MQQLDAPCHDEWAIDENGSSVVWLPSAIEEQKMEEFIPNNETVICYHKMPSGEVTILTDGGDIHFTEIIPFDGSYKLISRGIVARLE